MNNVSHTSLVAHDHSQADRLLVILLASPAFNIIPNITIFYKHVPWGKTLPFCDDEQHTFMEGNRVSCDGGLCTIK
jgi:hypothetical protein